MNEVCETTILKEGMVRITNLRVIFGAKTYALSNIAVARMAVKEANFFLPVFFAVMLGICSALVAISDIQEYSQCLQVGSYAGFAGILFFILSRRTKYTVRIRNQSGEVPVLETDDKDHAERVVRAINEAIAKQGEQVLQAMKRDRIQQT